ncbi:MAG: PIN domain-containing protein [Thalassobaculaceae bacterium]
MDLAVGHLLEAALSLPFEFVIPDVMVSEELLDLGGYSVDDLIQLGFQIGELSNASTALALHTKHRIDLSLNDCFALAMAEERRCVLMTGDGRLRRISADRGQVEAVRGTLWVTREIYETGVTEMAGLHAGLVRIQEHPRTRLPKVELDRQIVTVSNRLSG